MGKRLSPYELGQIKAYREHRNPLTFEEIARKLGRDKSTIVKAYGRIKNQKYPRRKVENGRNRKTTPRDERHIRIAIKQNHYLSNNNIKRDLNLNISEWTIGRRLRDIKLNSYWTLTKPFISKVNMKKRLLWARQHEHWTLRQWKSVLFSDESTFTLRYQQRKRVRRKRAES
jgi:hypothetical protein